MALDEKTLAAQRILFEQWVYKPPYEKAVSRYGPHESWPNQYRDYSVQLAWEAWCKVVSDTAGMVGHSQSVKKDG